MIEFAIITHVFRYVSIERYLKSFNSFTSGENYDLYLIHNKFEPKHIVNRYIRSEDEIHNIENILNLYKNKTNATILERENIGEDLGAFRYGYNLLKNKYKYYFFIGEKTIFKKNNWLSEFKNILENKEVGAVCPQIGKGIKYPFCLKTTYFCIKDYVLSTLNWPEPLNRKDAELQEMELFYPHIKSLNLYCANVGTGDNLMNYVYNDGTELDRRFWCCDFKKSKGILLF